MFKEKNSELMQRIEKRTNEEKRAISLDPRAQSAVPTILQEIFCLIVNFYCITLRFGYSIPVEIIFGDNCRFPPLLSYGSF